MKTTKTSKTPITASLVRQLREETNATMMDCKKALVESNGDFQKAKDWLFKPFEEEAICLGCWKPLGYKVTRYRCSLKYNHPEIEEPYCDKCKAENEEKKRLWKEEQDRKEQERIAKEEAHKKEMKELKESDPVAFMSIHYAVCRDCKMTQKCQNCQLKFCSICEDRDIETCKLCGETKDPKLTEFLKATLLELSKSQGNT